MAKWYESITPELHKFIEAQHMYFVASAPLSADGHVNVSPKGLDSFRILSPLRVGYMDMTGSGNETSAHLMENGRITLMFCAFEGAPRILRLYGKGRAIRPDMPEWEELAPQFNLTIGVRQIVIADIDGVMTACGFAVPLYDYQGDRDTLNKWSEVKGEDGLHAYWQQKNTCSIDGLPTSIAPEEAPAN